MILNKHNFPYVYTDIKFFRYNFRVLTLPRTLLFKKRVSIFYVISTPKTNSNSLATSIMTVFRFSRFMSEERLHVIPETRS